METKTELITPEKAEKYLNMNKGNRSLRVGVVEKYAYDMKTGNWTECVVPITFYEDGDIADGQHRLYAIVESGVAVKFLVLRGFPRTAGLNIDTGVARNLVDNAKIAGLADSLTHNLLSAAWFYEHGFKCRKGMSGAHRLAIAEKHRTVCMWALNHCPQVKGFRSAPIIAAVARAYAQGENESRIVEFAKVLTSGLSNGYEDYAAVSLRNYVIGRNFYSADGRDLFLKAMNALSYFLKRRPLKSIKTVEAEAFPLDTKKVSRAPVRVSRVRGEARAV